MYVIIDGTSFFFNGIACKFLALLFEQLRADYVPLFHTRLTFLKMNPLRGSLKQEESARKTEGKRAFPLLSHFPSLTPPLLTTLATQAIVCNVFG